MLIATAVSSAWSLTDEEVFREFRINLINPGARSLALGGAFVSLADDATAAQANPAGLAFLLRSEYFAEVRSIDNGARASIETGTLLDEIDTFAGTGSDLEDVVSPSFLSAVTTYGSFTVGLSRQELVNTENSTLSTYAFTFRETAATPGTFLAEQSGTIDIDVVNVNVSAGVRINDYLAVGGTLTLSRLDVRASVVNTLVDTGGSVTGEPILEPTLDLRTTLDDDDHDVVFGLGLIYKRPQKWSAGVVYRRGPDFTVAESIDAGPDLDGDGVADGLDFKQVVDRLGGRFLNRFHLPDVFGAGAGWQPSDRLSLALDVERILYSNLADGHVPGVNLLTDESWKFDAEDGTDVRLGVEYVFFNLDNRLPTLALRGGAFSESDSTLRARSAGAASLVPAEVFGGRDRQEHLSAGIGIILPRYKIDVAADFAESDNEYVVSLIFQGK